MENVNDCVALQVKEIVAGTSIAGTLSLPVSDMGQRVFNGDPFP